MIFDWFKSNFTVRPLVRKIIKIMEDKLYDKHIPWIYICYKTLQIYRVEGNILRIHYRIVDQLGLPFDGESFRITLNFMESNILIRQWRILEKEEDKIIDFERNCEEEKYINKIEELLK